MRNRRCRIKVADQVQPLKLPETQQDRLSRFWESFAPYAFISPFFIAFIVFQLFPILFSVYLSFADWNPYIHQGSGLTFVNFKHYETLVHDGRFLHSLQVTGIITISCTLIGTSLSVILAVLLDNIPEWLSMILRAVFFMPAVTSIVVITQIWKQLLNYRYGYLNAILENMGLDRHNWLGEPATALWALIIMLIWAGVGWDSLIIMSGLRSIPQELYEAAKIDGANGLRSFRHITRAAASPGAGFCFDNRVYLPLGDFRAHPIVNKRRAAS